MTKLARNMILAGLLLAIAGLIFGLVTSIYTGNEARLATYDAYRPVFEAVIQDGEWRAELAQANRWSTWQRRAATVHTHCINMGMLLILVGLLAPLLVRFRKQPALLWALIGAAWLYPLGLLLKFAGQLRWGEPLAALGAALAIAVLAWLFLNVSRALGRVAGS